MRSLNTLAPPQPDLTDSMKPNNDVQANKASSGSEAGGKRRYEKPAFSREQIFETMALACGKTAGTQGACNVVKKLS